MVVDLLFLGTMNGSIYPFRYSEGKQYDRRIKLRPFLCRFESCYTLEVLFR